MAALKGPLTRRFGDVNDPYRVEKWFASSVPRPSAWAGIIGLTGRKTAIIVPSNQSDFFPLSPRRSWSILTSRFPFPYKFRSSGRKFWMLSFRGFLVLMVLLL